MSKPILGYLVEAAVKLFTPRKIGGVEFDGTQDIDLPGVNKKGNQDTTGTAAGLASARNLTIGSAAKAFDGSADISWTLAEIGAVSQTTFDTVIGDIESVLLDINGEAP